MNLNVLPALGKIAGIGGIALGVVVLLGDRLVGTVAGLPAVDRGPAVQLLTICTFGIGVAGLLVWLFAARSGGPSARTEGNNAPAINAGGNVSVNVPPPAEPPAPTRGAKVSAPTMPQGSARTKGDDSAAVNAGGSATVNTHMPPPPQ